MIRSSLIVFALLPALAAGVLAAGALAETQAAVPLVAASPGAHPHKPTHHPAKTKPGPAVLPPATPPVPPAAPVQTPVRPDPTKGATTGLPLPRWAALRSDEVNLRSGPGMQYPIDWQYHRRDLPVRITREFEVWRLVEMPDGTKDWVHQATLTGRRGFIVTDAERVLRATPDDAAAPVARLQVGVVGTIRACDAAKPWCEVQAGGYRGFLRRAEVWGVDPDEAIN